MVAQGVGMRTSRKSEIGAELGLDSRHSQTELGIPNGILLLKPNACPKREFLKKYRDHSFHATEEGTVVSKVSATCTGAQQFQSQGLNADPSACLCSPHSPAQGCTPCQDR